MQPITNVYQFFDESLGPLPLSHASLEETKNNLAEAKKAIDEGWAEITDPTSLEQSKHIKILSLHHAAQEKLAQTEEKKNTTEKNLVVARNSFILHQKMQEPLNSTKHKIALLLYRAILTCYEAIQHTTRQKKDEDQSSNRWQKNDVERKRRIKKLNKLISIIMPIMNEDVLPSFATFYEKLAAKNLIEIEDLINKILQVPEAETEKLPIEIKKLVTENEAKQEKSQFSMTADGKFIFSDESLKRLEGKIKDQAQVTRAALRTNTDVVAYVKEVHTTTDMVNAFLKKARRFKSYTASLMSLRSKRKQIQQQKELLQTKQEKCAELIEYIKEQQKEIARLDTENNTTSTQTSAAGIETLRDDIQALMQIVVGILEYAKNMELSKHHSKERKKQLTLLDEKILSTQEVNLAMPIAEVNSINVAATLIKHKKNQLEQMIDNNLRIIQNQKNEVVRRNTEIANRASLQALIATLQSFKEIKKALDEQIDQAKSSIHSEESMTYLLEYEMLKQDLQKITSKLASGSYSDAEVAQIDNTIVICKAKIDKLLFIHHKIVHDLPMYITLQAELAETKMNLLSLEAMLPEEIDERASSEDIKLNYLVQQFTRYKTQIIELHQRIAESGLEGFYDGNTTAEADQELQQTLKKVRQINTAAKICFKAILDHADTHQLNYDEEGITALIENDKFEIPTADEQPSAISATVSNLALVTAQDQHAFAKFYYMLVGSIEILQAKYFELKEHAHSDELTKTDAQRKLEIVTKNLYELKKLRLEVEAEIISGNANDKRAAIADEIYALKEAIASTRIALGHAIQDKDKIQIRSQKKILSVLEKQLRVEQERYKYALNRDRKACRINMAANWTENYLLQKMERFNDIAVNFDKAMGDMLLERKNSMPKTKYFLERFRERIVDGIRGLFSQHAALSSYNHYSTYKTSKVIMKKAGRMFSLFQRQQKSKSNQIEKDAPLKITQIRPLAAK